jgi:hypothetical protein
VTLLALNITKTLLDADDGVIDRLWLVVTNTFCEFVVKLLVFTFDTTCNTDPAGKPVVDALLSRVPELSGKFSVRSVFVPGEAMVNVPVPEALPDRVILDNLVLLGGGWLLGQPYGVLRLCLCDFFGGEFDLRHFTRLDVYDCAVHGLLVHDVDGAGVEGVCAVAVHGLSFIQNVDGASVKGVCAVDCGDAYSVEDAGEGDITAGRKKRPRRCAKNGRLDPLVSAEIADFHLPACSKICKNQSKTEACCVC